ncbi:MAG: hypothetical protein ACRC41_06295 [Sarcina sp.]
MKYIEGRIYTEKLINLDEFIEKKHIEVNKLFNPSNKELLVIKAYRKVLNEITKADTEALEQVLELNISRVKSRARELKISSLKQRGEAEKKEILIRGEKILEDYKSLLKENINIIRNTEKDKIFFVYRVKENKEIVCAIPANIEVIEGDIHMKRDEGREIIVNDNYLKEDSDEVILLDDIEKILEFQLQNTISIKIEKIDFLKKESFNAKYFKDSRIMNFELSTIKFSRENIDNVLSTSKDYKIYSSNTKDDIEEYILYACNKNKKVCYIIDDEIEENINIEYFDKKSEQGICNLNLKVKDDKNLKILYDEISTNEHFSFDEYEMCKKNLNLDSFSYNELSNILDEIKCEEIEILREYKDIKKKNFYDEKIVCTLEDGKNIIILLQKLKRKISYADIIKLDEYQKIILMLSNKNDILNNDNFIEISNICENKTISNNHKWRFKNIFAIKDNASSAQELNKSKKVIEIYNIFSKELEEIKLLNERIFTKTIEALKSNNMNAAINVISNDLKLRVDMLIFLDRINTWNSSKYALIDFISTSINITNFKEKILIFKKAKEFESIFRDINLEKVEFKSIFLDENYRKTLEKVNQVATKEIFLDIALKENFEFVRELIYEKYDIIITKKIDEDNIEKYLPYAYEAKKVLSFINK